MPNNNTDPATAKRSPSKARLLLAAVLATTAITGVATATIEPANAQTVAIHISGTGGDGVRLRTDTNTSSATLTVIPEGAAPPIACAQSGQTINGVAIWMRATWNGKTGFYASAYDDSHFSSWADLYNKYGIPQCGTTPAPTPTPSVTGAQQTAMNWAKGQVGSYGYQGQCLKFVFDAYTAAGVNLRSQVNYSIGNNTYPIDIWGKFTRGTTGTGTPPNGALVFYAAKNGDRTLSHVVLSVGGGGNTVSTADSLGTPIHYETVAQHNYANYLGWWLPAS
ncbi:MAG: hypothetical protein JWP74_1522 [Marmoricola sp.]|nr:hypothetical protein [Marmoricola sp.]